jgi:hypothetical protein
MTDHDRQPHWQGVYTSKGEAEVSWFQESPATSLELIALAGVSPAVPSSISAEVRRAWSTRCWIAVSGGLGA